MSNMQRHCVGKRGNLPRTEGGDGLGTFAKALGDTRETILKVPSW
jgi:hypothetical protein